MFINSKISYRVNGQNNFYQTADEHEIFHPMILSVQFRACAERDRFIDK